MKEDSNMKIKNSPVFALGTGRCGTKFLAKTLSHEARIASHHERDPFNDTFHRYCKWYDLPVDHAGFIQTKKMGIDSDMLTKDFSFESSAFLSLSVAELYQYFDAKFILLVRSPEDVINSYLKKGWYDREFHYSDPHKIPSFQSNLQEHHHFLGRTLPKGDEYAEWAACSRVGKLAWYWSMLNNRVIDQFKAIPSANKMVLRIEDLDYEKYRELTGFIGFESKLKNDFFDSIAEARPNQIAGKNVTINDWDAAQQSEFKKYCHSAAASFGYDVDKILHSPPPLEERVPEGKSFANRIIGGLQNLYSGKS